MSRSCGCVTAIKHNDVEDFPLWVGGIAAHSELSAKGGLSEADRHLDKPEKQAEVAGFTAKWSATTPELVEVSWRQAERSRKNSLIPVSVLPSK